MVAEPILVADRFLLGHKTTFTVVCSCHGEPMLRHSDPRTPRGHVYRCAEKRRANQREQVKRPHRRSQMLTQARRVRGWFDEPTTLRPLEGA